MEGGVSEESREDCDQAGSTPSTSKVPRTEVASMGLALLTKAEATKISGLESDWWLLSLQSELRVRSGSQRNDSREGKGDFVPQGP